MQVNHEPTTTRLAPSWREVLDAETTHVDSAGIQAAVVVARLTEPIDLSESDANKAADNVLRGCLNPTDRFGRTAPNDFSVLLAPTTELRETIRRVHQINRTLADHGYDAVCSFAHRRPHERLVDSWARAQAELDRRVFRDTHGGGLSI